MIKVTVPATSANIGGGFDCLGLAVSVYNEVYLRESDVFKIETDKDLSAGTDNLVYRSITAAFDLAAEKTEGKERPEILKRYLASPETPLGIYLKQVNRIPKTSGMGSSAASIVAGVTGAAKLLGGILNKTDMIALCTKLDGHPDNVLPAILGGVTAAAVMPDGTVEYVHTAPPKELKLNLYTPCFPLETRVARKVLPDKYAREDVVYSLSRAVLTYAALASGDVKALRRVVGDKLHEPYRAGLIPDFEQVVEMNGEAGALAVFLSGAGPSVAAFVTEKFKAEDVRKKLGFLPNNWRMQECEIARSGVKTEEIQ